MAREHMTFFKKYTSAQRIDRQNCQSAKVSMKHVIAILLVLVLNLIIKGCIRENSYQDCLPDVKTVGTLNNVRGRISLIGSPAKYAIYVEGEDTAEFIPCNLPESFKIQGLQITVSGLVKYTLDPCFTPGCPQGFVITRIAK
jgi:hypothetical protein